jgi:predicted regulator of Ras-like GTPase activity (Roadblock/LC7/MglB family)
MMEDEPEKRESQSDGGGNGSGSKPPNQKTRGGDGREEFNPEPGQAFLCSIIKQVSDLYLVIETVTKVEGYLSAPGYQMSVGNLVLCEFVGFESFGPLFSCAARNVNGEDGVKIISMEASGELRKLLGTLNECPGVIGSLIVGDDGLIIASILPSSVDAELLASVATMLNSQSEHFVKSIGRDRLFQIVLQTERSRLILADFGGGILIVVMEGGAISMFPTIRRVTKLMLS